ncbi:gliding motility lipoprotein GldB [uncultured Algibacter sp.]|uniref:gliding motility lipoprotein GldB n=1 Tax=uncultured Algibacter sp. TaxID=298659 RepID=UPI003217D13F
MPFKFYTKIGILTIIFIFAFISCKKEDKLEQNIAKIHVDINVERFDTLFANVTSNNLPKLKEAYPFMFSKRYPDSFWIEKQKDTLQAELMHEVNRTFKDIDAVENDIELFYKHLKYYFPESNTPRLITITNDVDYRNKIIVTDTIALLALDCYLGKDHEFYAGIPKYLRTNFTKEHIVVDLADAYAKKNIYQDKNKTLLDEMIYFGKQLCFKDAVIPFKSDAERIGYSQGQLDWAIANESDIWRFFVKRELLFSTDSKLLGRFINPAPFTKFYLEEIDADSPGRLGQYIGWQIVRAYLNQNDVSLKDMLITSTEDIFNNSKFKPRK